MSNVTVKLALSGLFLCAPPITGTSGYPLSSFAASIDQ